jgi:hypothetical protein
MSDISGTQLEFMGFEKSGNWYTKGTANIFFDGSMWWLNGKRISTIEDIPETFKKKAVRFTANVPIKKAP